MKAPLAWPVAPASRGAAGPMQFCNSALCWSTSCSADVAVIVVSSGAWPNPSWLRAHRLHNPVTCWCALDHESLHCKTTAIQCIVYFFYDGVEKPMQRKKLQFKSLRRRGIWRLLSCAHQVKRCSKLGTTCHNRWQNSSLASHSFPLPPATSPRRPATGEVDGLALTCRLLPVTE